MACQGRSTAGAAALILQQAVVPPIAAALPACRPVSQRFPRHAAQQTAAATMGRKIIDKLNEKIAAGELFYSFEYFPPKTDEGVQNLVERQHRMFGLGPTFCDITWGAGGSTADLTLDIASRMQNEVRGRAALWPHARRGPGPILADRASILSLLARRWAWRR